MRLIDNLFKNIGYVPLTSVQESNKQTKRELTKKENRITRDFIWETKETLNIIAKNSRVEISNENKEILSFVASMIPNRFRISISGPDSNFNKNSHEYSMMKKYSLDSLFEISVSDWIFFYRCLYESNSLEKSIRAVKNKRRK